MNTKIKQTLKLLLVVTLLVSLTGAAQVANVYICTGRYAKVYHSNKNCKGLDNCKGEVKLVSLETAKQQGKRACKLCYKKQRESPITKFRCLAMGNSGLWNLNSILPPILFYPVKHIFGLSWSKAGPRVSISIQFNNHNSIFRIKLTYFVSKY